LDWAVLKLAEQTAGIMAGTHTIAMKTKQVLMIMLLIGNSFTATSERQPRVRFLK
jgi:hypothetical protein